MEARRFAGNPSCQLNQSSRKDQLGMDHLMESRFESGVCQERKTNIQKRQNYIIHSDILHPILINYIISQDSVSFLGSKFHWLQLTKQACLASPITCNCRLQMAPFGLWTKSLWWTTLNQGPQWPRYFLNLIDAIANGIKGHKLLCCVSELTERSRGSSTSSIDLACPFNC